ncbi:hypothetical protein HYU19_05595 [Candidatus Woesearchaeota archaeon]|nr:hypothetical protein [Candidatus Woesearchaeota archaeon]
MSDLETAKMSMRGQVIIPKRIREAMGAKEDSTLAFILLDNNRILLTRLEREKIVQEFDQLRNSIRNKRSEEEIEDVIRDVRKKRKNQL